MVVVDAVHAIAPGAGPLVAAKEEFKGSRRVIGREPYDRLVDQERQAVVVGVCAVVGQGMNHCVGRGGGVLRHVSVSPMLATPGTTATIDDCSID
jgi:hypothetical protein